jgi:aminomethyltransferase
VLDAGGKKIGEVLTCVTDMGIGRREDRIYSIASPDKPENFQPKGLSCGFVKTAIRLSPGQTVTLKDSRRKIEVVIAGNIRPDRTARRPIRQMTAFGR